MSTPKVAIVTGASGGIGSAVAKRLAADGWVVVGAARSADDLARTAEAVSAGRGGPVFIPCVADVSTEDGAQAVVEAALAAGRLDLLVNGAGWVPRRTALESPAWLFDKCYTANARTMFVMSTAAARVMGEGSAIVNLASVIGVRTMVERAAYGAAKAAVLYLTRALALEWGPNGIAVNAVAPGVTLTEPVRKLLAQEGPDPTRLRETSATGRFPTPEDIAGLVADLARQPRHLVTGQVWSMDGGWMAG